MFKIEPQVEGSDGIRKVLKGFKITAFGKYVSGSYMLGVTAYNAGSPTSMKMYRILMVDLTNTEDSGIFSSVCLRMRAAVQRQCQFVKLSS